MGVTDVNPLVYAHRSESPRHRDWLAWLEGTLDGGTPFNVPRVVALAFYRISTDARIFAQPSQPSEAIEFLDWVLGAPAAQLMSEPPGHWDRFTQLCADLPIGGRHATDAYIAAFAIETGDELWTADRGFSRFPGLRVRNPLA